MVEKQKTTINPINDDDKFFQYAATVTLNHEKIRKISQRISKVKPFINKQNWKRINYPSGKGDSKNFEKNKPTIALNVLYVKK